MNITTTLTNEDMFMDADKKELKFDTAELAHLKATLGMESCVDTLPSLEPVSAVPLLKFCSRHTTSASCRSQSSSQTCTHPASVRISTVPKFVTPRDFNRTVKKV